MPQTPEKRCPHCAECSSEHLGGQENHSPECRHGQKITAQSSFVPCDSVNTSPKYLPKTPRCLPETSQCLPKAPQPLPETLRQHQCLQETLQLRQLQHPANLGTLRQPRHPANLDTLCVTKCHYLSFGKCFDVTEACRQRWRTE